LEELLIFLLHAGCIPDFNCKYLYKNHVLLRSFCAGYLSKTRENYIAKNEDKLHLLESFPIAGVDGTLARRAKVSEVIPWFDGSIVDIVVDYLTWTFIPAVFMYVGLDMGPKPVAGLLMALILTSSMFCYANKQWRSTDYYFVGFPAAWTIVALMFYVLGTPAIVNIIVTLVLAVLTLVPTHYVHPARVKRFRTFNIAAVALWFLATCWLVAIYPERPLSTVAVIVVCGGWVLLAGCLRSIRGAELVTEPSTTPDTEPASSDDS